MSVFSPVSKGLFTKHYLQKKQKDSYSGRFLCHSCWRKTILEIYRIALLKPCEVR